MLTFFQDNTCRSNDLKALVSPFALDGVFFLIRSYKMVVGHSQTAYMYIGQSFAYIYIGQSFTISRAILTKVGVAS